MEYETDAMNLAQAYRASAGQNAAMSLAKPAAVPCLADRLGRLLETANMTGSSLASARERLCGPWGENATEARLQAVPKGQIDGLLSDLEDALSRNLTHAGAINGRI